MTAAGPGTGDSSVDVLGAERRWRAAIASLDLETLRSLMDPGATFTHGTGFTHQSRDHFLERFKGGWSLEPEGDANVRLHGNVAVITGDYLLNLDGQDPLRVAVTQVWVDDDGWKQVAFHDTLHREQPGRA